MYLSRCPILQALMKPLVVVESKVTGQAGDQSEHGGIIFQVNVLVLDGSPQALDKDVIQGATSAIHTDADVGRFQDTSKGQRRELSALVSVENLGLTVL